MVITTPSELRTVLPADSSPFLALSASDLDLDRYARVLRLVVDEATWFVYEEDGAALPLPPVLSVLRSARSVSCALRFRLPGGAELSASLFSVSELELWLDRGRVSSTESFAGLVSFLSRLAPLTGPLQLRTASGPRFRCSVEGAVLVLA